MGNDQARVQRLGAGTWFLCKMLSGLLWCWIASGGLRAMAQEEEPDPWQRFFAATNQLRSEEQHEEGVLAATQLYFELHDPVLFQEQDDEVAIQAFLGICLRIGQYRDSFGEDLPSAAEVFEEAREAASLHSSSDFGGWVEFEAARHWLRQGDLDTALATVRSALKRHGTSSTYEFPFRHFLAEILRQRAEWSAGLECLEEMEQRLDLREKDLPEQQAALWRARLSSARTQAYRALGLHDLAFQELDREREFAEKSDDLTAKATHAVNAADLAMASERFGMMLDGIAKARAEEGLLDALEPEHRVHFDLYEAFALVERNRETGEDAEATRVKVEGVLESPFLSLEQRLLAQRVRVDLALQERDWEIAESWLQESRRRLGEKGGTGVGPAQEEAFLVRDQVRLSLARGDSRDQLRLLEQPMREAFDRFLRQWLATPQRPGGVGFLDRGDRRSVLAVMVQLALALEPKQTDQAIDILLQTEAAGTRARELGLPPATVASVRKELVRDDHGILLFLPSKDQGFAFLVTRQGSQAFVLPPRDGCRNAARRLLSALLVQRQGNWSDASVRTGAVAALKERGREVGALMFPAVLEEALSPLTRLSILGTDEFFQMPVECVVLSSGERVGGRFEVDRWPSLAYALHLQRREERRAPCKSELVVIENLRPQEQSLDRWSLVSPQRAPSLKSWTSFYPPDGVTQISNTACSVRSIEALDLSSATVLHLLAHGVYLPGRERGSALLFAADSTDDGFLTCDRVENWDVGPVVVLSACGTARGPGRSGDDEVAHLGGAFLKAGASAVVLGQAELELEATRQLMARFHRKLRGGVSVAAALREARIEQTATDPSHVFEAYSTYVLGHGQRAYFTP